ncbi:MAG: XRE family transcriptional regulator [Bacteroidales bacterium]|jgi:predicted transcriptional regulator|nr:XRE family transcriptional regulator [Bacteroidales bacterium]
MKENEIHIGNLIKKKLKENGQTITWLSKKVHKEYSCLYKSLYKKDIETDLLISISIALKFNYFTLYSEFIENKIN